MQLARLPRHLLAGRTRAWLTGWLEPYLAETHFFYLSGLFSVAAISLLALPNLRRDEVRIAAFG